MKRHYIYRVEHIETKEFYYGVRSCKCEPKDDPYMGSMKTWKPDKTKLVKTDIIEYNTREEANEAEEVVLKYFIDKNKFPLNRNYHNGKTFCTLGYKFSEESKNKMSESLKGHSFSSETRLKISNAKKYKNTWNKGKILSQIYRDKMSIKRNIYYNGEFVYYSVGDFKEFCKNNKIWMTGLCRAYKQGLSYKGYTVEVINKI